MRILLVCACVLALQCAANAADRKPAQKKATTTYEGCLDQSGEDYVLRGERVLRLIARLEPVGFDKTLFARFVGQKVSVPGKLAESGDPPVLRVTNINGVKKLSDFCAPGEP